MPSGLEGPDPLNTDTSELTVLSDLVHCLPWNVLLTNCFSCLETQNLEEAQGPHYRATSTSMTMSAMSALRCVRKGLSTS